jgi:OOP family OmpA-OmpF porin
MNSVKNYIVKKGVEPGRVSGQGFGETKPIADNKTKEGRAKNRRVEVNVQ